MTCEIHPACQDQGCTADPTKCQMVTDRNTTFKNHDDAGKLRVIRYLLNMPDRHPLPHTWAAWLLDKYTKTGPL